MKNKIIIYISIIIVGLSIVFAKLYFDYTKSHSIQNEETTDSDTEYYKMINELYGMSRMAILMDKNNVSYDKTINSELKTYANDILAKISLDDLTMEQLAQIIICTSYLDMEDEKYINAIKNYYYNGLLYGVDNIDEDALDGLYESAAFTTAYVYNLLEISNVNLNDYPVKEQMIKYYNSAPASDDLSTFLYFFHQYGWLNEVDYMKQKDIFQGYYDSTLSSVLDNNYSLTYAELGSSFSFIEICKTMGIDTTELEKWYKELKIPNDASALGLLPGNSNTYALFMSAIYWNDLYYPETCLISYPNHFFDLFSKSYEDYYNNSLKPSIESLLAG